jgi:fengycin family lipopeptide synthetase D
MDPRSGAYFQQTLFFIHGDIDKELLTRSFNLIMQKYETLRTAFIYEKIKKPKQVVKRSIDFNIPFEDISHLEKQQLEHFLAEFRRKDKERGFDLSRDALLRIALFKAGTSRYVMVLSFHHIIMDGWCIGIIYRNLMQIYQALKAGKPVSPKTAPPYRHFIQWLEKQDKKKAIEFWRRYLEDYEQKAGLPGTRDQLPEEQYRLAEHHLVIDNQSTAALNRIARNNQVTLSVLFRCTWGILLQRYNNCRDVVLGMVVSGRPTGIEGIESMVGLFINTVPLRIRTGKDTPFSQLLKTVQAGDAGSKPYEYISLAEIQAQTPLKNNLLDHVMVYENYPLEQTVKEVKNKSTSGFSISGVEGVEQTNYQFNIIMASGKGTIVKFNYNANTFTGQSIARIASQFHQSVRAVIGNPNIPVDDIQIISNEEKQEILEQFNRTEAHYPTGITILDVFERQVSKRAGETAVIHEETGQLTFDRLNREALRLARLLRRKGVTGGTTVAVMADRSLEMVAGILAVFKAGGAYLPIEPGYPAQRTRFLMEDSRAGALLTLRRLDSEKLKGFERKIIYMDDYAGEQTPGPPDLSTAAANQESTAYIIYTSGSTGKPKGVLVSHKSVVNILHDMEARYPCGPGDAYLLKTNFTFDVSVTELFGWFFGGGKLVILGENKEKDASSLSAAMRRFRVSHVNFAPSLLNAYLDASAHHLPLRLPSLKYLFVAGEAFSLALFKKAVNSGLTCKVENIFGPTEATIYTTACSLRMSQSYQRIPIGKPMGNVSNYILDIAGHLAPVDVPGELCIGGVGVAGGYLNRPQLTKEKFNPDPFNPGGRLYRTGDLAVWRDNGSIDYLGRIDQQLKIRGFRIEPGEIENRLVEIGGIKEAAVLHRENKFGEKYLCAYIVPAGDQAPDINTIRNAITRKLPYYMIPSHFNVIDTIPLTPSGKVNRKQLPDPETGIPENTVEYNPPRNWIEHKLVRIWKELLEIPHPIGIDHHFFHLGGHSLTGVRLIARIQKEMGIKIRIKDIFDAPTVRTLAEFLNREEAGKIAFPDVEPNETREYYPLSSGQKRLYILQRMEESMTVYNLPKIWPLAGVFDMEKLAETFNALIERHESLRTCFELVNGEPVQTVRDAADIPFKIDCYEVDPDNAHEEISAIIRRFIRPFDLSKAPLIRAAKISLSKHRHLFVIDIHHIVSDGASLEIIKNELFSLYRGEALPVLTIQYKDFALWQNKFFASLLSERQEQFWLNRFSGDIPIMNLPVDFPRSPKISYEGAVVSGKIGGDLTRRLNSLVLVEETTLYILILAVYNVLIAKLSGQRDIIIGTVVEGRNKTEFQNIVGMFANTLALRHYPDKDKPFNRFLKEVTSHTLDAFENQDYQFENLVEKVLFTRIPGRRPILDVGYSYLRVNTAPQKSASGENDEFNISRIDLNLNATDFGNDISIQFEYCKKLFKKESIQRFLEYFKTIFSIVLEDKTILLEDIKIYDDFAETKTGDVEIDFGF